MGPHIWDYTATYFSFNHQSVRDAIRRLLDPDDTIGSDRKVSAIPRAIPGRAPFILRSKKTHQMALASIQ